MILVSTDGFNEVPGWRSLIVVPVSTSSAQVKRGPTVVEIPSGVAGLAALPRLSCKKSTIASRRLSIWTNAAF